MTGEDTALSGDESSSSQWRDLAVETTLAYDRIFGKHHVSAMGRFNYDDCTTSSGSLPYMNLGFAFSANYTYDGRYMAEFTSGYYGNDNFPSYARYGFFPAGAIGWVISNEESLRGSSVVNLLKLRASCGLVGNADIGAAVSCTTSIGNMAVPTSLEHLTAEWRHTLRICLPTLM